MAEPHSIRPVFWMGSSRADLSKMPEDAKDSVGYALFDAQTGGMNSNAKPLRGFGGAGVVEIVENHDGDTYRAVYTVQLAGRIYVLHVFQKKSKSGIKTPERDLRLIRARLADAEKIHSLWLGAGQRRSHDG